MNSYGAIPFVRIAVPFATGILLYAVWLIHISAWWLAGTIAVTLFLQFYFKKSASRMFRHGHWLGAGLNLSLLLAGNQLAYYRSDINSDNHFLNASVSAAYARIRLLEPPVEKERSYKALVKVVAVGTKVNVVEVKGKSIIYLQNDSVAEQLKYGDELLVKYRFEAVSPPMNPDEFDYRKYLWNQEIYATQFLKQKEWMLLSRDHGSMVKKVSFWLRDHCRLAFQKTIRWSKEEAVMEALVVGYRDGMAPEVQQAYANAGVVHVLAVSGLHVGILYLVLEKLLFFMRRRKSWLKWQTSLIVLVVWLFAFVTGLSGSVVRAATMFSLITIGRNWSRSADSFNNIAASAVVILIFNPLLLMDVGFQLSYAAVISITAFVPHMNWWFTRETKGGDFLWRTSSMSLAAQAGTLPLTVFYFKQFPVLFLIANIIVIPLSGVLLVGGMVLALLQWTGPVAIVIGFIIQILCRAMNWIIELIGSVSFSVIHLEKSSWGQTIMLLLIIVLLTQYFLRQHRNYFYAATGMLCLLLFSTAWSELQNVFRKEVTFFAFRGHSVLEFRSGNNCLLICDTSIRRDRWRQKYLSDYHQWNGITASTEVNWNALTSRFTGSSLFFQNDYFQFQNLKMVRISRPLNQRIPVTRMAVDAILVSESPRISIPHLLNYFDTPLIIFDGSNKPYRVKRWMEEADSLHVRSHYVLADGALSLNL